jgi:hypothetical protein
MSEMNGEQDQRVIQSHEITCPRQRIILTYLRSLRYKGWDSLVNCYYQWHFVLSSDMRDYEPCICHWRIASISDDWIRPLLIQMKKALIWDYNNKIANDFYCKHGIFVGDAYGADHMCQACEDDIQPEDLQFPWHVAISNATTDSLPDNINYENRASFRRR